VDVRLLGVLHRLLRLAPLVGHPCLSVPCSSLSLPCALLFALSLLLYVCGWTRAGSTLKRCCRRSTGPSRCPHVQRCAYAAALESSGTLLLAAAERRRVLAAVVGM
jgi:hypothetical protein